MSIKAYNKMLHSRSKNVVINNKSIQHASDQRRNIQDAIAKGVIANDSSNGRKNFTTRSNAISLRLSLLITVIFVATCLTACGIAYMRNQNAQATARKIAAQTRATEVSANNAATLGRARKLDDAFQFGAEQKLLESYLATNPPQQFKLRALIQLGLLQYRDKHYKTALDLYHQAEALNGQKDLAVVLGIAMSSAASGDKQTAISYYKKAIDILNTQQYASQQGSFALQEYMSAIKALGGKP
jgi:tetratricopeptide (TPR) repeat protein